jgi:hypothetical protein
MSLGMPWLASPTVAQGAADSFWIFVTANGGWDPRFLFDPTLNVAQNRIYTEIGQVGNIRFAPIDATPDEFGLEEGQEALYLNPERFLNRFGSRLTVLNGVDTSTNNHDAGQRAVTSGSISEGLPAMGAMLAATYGLEMPLPFVSFGGYDSTFDLAPLSRIGSSNLLRDLAAPNLINPQDENPTPYHTEDTWERIRNAQRQRLADLRDSQALPRLQRSLDALTNARQTDSQLAALQIPEPVDLPGNLNAAENMIRSGQLAVSAFKSGLAIASNLSMGGFDTHGSHDQNQRRQMIQMLTGLGGLLDVIEGEGMSDRITVLIGSDFGRTPNYNGEGNGSGKDHWPVTSYLAIGAGIEGDRTIGATTDEQQARFIDPATLEVAASGTKITPGQIHSALRKMANLDPEVIAAYPLIGDELPLFG